MLFGTSRKLSNIDKPLNIKYRGSDINNTNSYEYLGNLIDRSVLLNTNFEKRYKKASGRIRLLKRVRQYLTVDAAEKIFNMMIVPLLTYCSLLKLPLTRTQTSLRTFMQDQAIKIIYENNANHKRNIVSIIHQRKVRCCITVWKCLHDEGCSSMKKYFDINEHNLGTRNQNCLLKLPKLRLEIGRQRFAYSGAKLYNDLPIIIRKEEIFSNFVKNVKSFSF